MGRLYKRIICIVLALVMAFGASVTAFAEEEQSLEDAIRPQIEAFAKSIDQKDADGKAADALATHGMFKNGKDLSVGEDHALTATLMNSEVVKEYLTALCAELIRTTTELNGNEAYSLGLSNWAYGEYSWRFWIYNYDATKYVSNSGIDECPGNYLSTIKKSVVSDYKYDQSLEWIVGICDTDIDLEIARVEKEKIIYNIEGVFWDDFDFHTSNGDGFKDFISGIGALLFKEFTWYSTFDFQIEIPNDCEHFFSEWKTAAKPNCTENGREERTCANCGCVETKETAALGHSFGEWQETKAPTYFEEGEERRTCSNCGHYETRAVGTLEFLLGDANGDEKINVLDANIVRKYAAKSAELSEKQLAAADTNGDGSVNVLDANLIRKFAAKIIDSFPIT